MSKVFTTRGRSRRVDADRVGVHDGDEPSEDDHASSVGDALDAHIEALAAAYVTLGRRTSRRLAIAWLWAARRHLALVRDYAGTMGEALDDGPERAGRPKDRALAGALYLVVFCGELDAVTAPERTLVETAYLPSSGGTDRAPYRGHRLPDSELAARVLGVPRGQAREARDRLLVVLLAMTERWWARFRCSRVREAPRGEQVLAHLAWETFTPTVYDVWRLEALRPQGRGDLDFQQWRGKDTMGRSRRGGGPKPPGPAAGLSEPVARAYVRGELSVDDELDVARHLILRAPTAEIRRLAELAEAAIPGGPWFERLRALAAGASEGAIAFLARLEGGVPMPAMLDADRRWLGDGEVVAIRVAATEPHTWVAVLARVSGGPPEWVLTWTRLEPARAPVEVCGYALDDGEEDVELLVAVVHEEPPEATEAIDALEELAALRPGVVRLGGCRLVKRPSVDGQGAQ